jgi:hypothetical protein
VDKLRQMIDGPQAFRRSRQGGGGGVKKKHQMLVQNPTLMSLTWPHRNEKRVFTKLALRYRGGVVCGVEGGL